VASPATRRWSHSIFGLSVCMTWACVCSCVIIGLTVEVCELSQTTRGNFTKFANKMPFRTKMKWLDFKVKRSKVKLTTRPNIGNISCSKMHLSGEGGSPSKIIYFFLKYDKYHKLSRFMSKSKKNRFHHLCSYDLTTGKVHIIIIIIIIVIINLLVLFAFNLSFSRKTKWSYWCTCFH